ncbi:MAG TPA: lysophospholipid acyltransferase family protein [Gemmatimonadales bacterium]|nr:lysophospholipid acyltransferase family protein [Gemmatimonadales bacterium]
MRLLGLFLWLAGGTVVTAIGALLLWPFPPLAGSWRRAMFRLLSRGTAWILGIRVRVIGPLPRPPYLLVSNHLSYLDVFTLATILPARFVAKREVRRWPIIGPLAWLLGTVFIHREQKRDALRVHDELDDIVTGQDGAMIFPEATSGDGSRVLPFRPALLEWAAARSFPVHVAAFSYLVGPDEPDVVQSVHWWGDMPFGSHFFGLARLTGVETTIRFAAEPITSPDRKQLATRLHAAVSALFTPTHPSSP